MPAWLLQNDCVGTFSKQTTTTYSAGFLQPLLTQVLHTIGLPSNHSLILQQKQQKSMDYMLEMLN